MNKRAHTPTILLFIVTLILIVVALFSFASFDGEFAKDSKERSQILEDVAFLEQYIIKQAEITGSEIIASGGLIMSNDAIKSRFQENTAKKNLGIEGAEEYFERIKNGDFVFIYESNGYVFEINYLVISSKSGANSFNRTLGFEIEFDFEGNVIKIERNKSPI